MNPIIPQTVNFAELVKTSKTTLTLTSQSKMITLLNENFTEKEIQWNIANLYMYMNYHPTNDYLINRINGLNTASSTHSIKLVF